MGAKLDHGSKVTPQSLAKNRETFAKRRRSLCEAKYPMCNGELLSKRHGNIAAKAVRLGGSNRHFGSGHSIRNNSSVSGSVTISKGPKAEANTGKIVIK